MASWWQRIFLVASSVAAAACGPNAEQLQLRQLAVQLDALRREVARNQESIATLNNQMYVANSRRQKEPARVAEPVPVPPQLSVVKLVPELEATRAAPSQQPEAPVAISLTGDPADVPLPVVSVPPAPKSVAAPSGPSADQMFREGLEAFQKGDPNEALRRLSSFADKFPRHPRRDNALYWMGEAHLELGQYRAAVARFEQLRERYPKSDAAQNALLKSGLAFERLGDSTRAHQVFEQVLRQYPGSAVADLARARMAEGTGSGVRQ